MLPLDVLSHIFSFSKVALFNYRLAMNYTYTYTSKEIEELFLEVNTTQQFELLYLHYPVTELVDPFSLQLVEQNRTDIIGFFLSKDVGIRNCLTNCIDKENTLVFMFLVEIGYVNLEPYSRYCNHYTGILPPWLFFVLTTLDQMEENRYIT